MCHTAFRVLGIGKHWQAVQTGSTIWYHLPYHLGFSPSAGGGMTLAGSASGLECNELVQTAITREMKQSTVTSLPHLSFVRLMHYLQF